MGGGWSGWAVAPIWGQPLSHIWGDIQTARQSVCILEIIFPIFNDNRSQDRFDRSQDKFRNRKIDTGSRTSTLSTTQFT